MMALIGFASVSTNQQDLTSQAERLTEYGCEKIFQGKHSGKEESNKQALASLIDYVRSGDTVVVTKLDRLSRALSQVLNCLDTFTDKQVVFVAIEQGIDTSNKKDPLSKAMVQLLGMFAELERNFIISRTREGKAASGNYGGLKPKLNSKQEQEVITKLSQGVSKVVLNKQYGVSRATILNISRKVV
ncbi:recombinase family protein [Salinimonas lutimaris]|uniref:recombinase family protein n=1 Tax=Salinimonas lutimaris TaxID=914153 RepID=UPI001E2CCF24|nr:recombinase family protein [Salinimonas lutimaris]